jgi:hypothetical protein
MKIRINGSDIDVNDDDGLLKACHEIAGQQVLLVDQQDKLPALVEMIAAIRYGYLKAGAVLAIAEARGLATVPRDALAQFVAYLADVIGETIPKIETVEAAANDGDSKTGA